MARLRVISFDAAGTLIHVREPVGETYAGFGRRHGVEASAAALKAAFKELWPQVPPPLHPEGQGAPDDDRSWWHDFASRVFAAALGQPVAEERFEPLFGDLYRHYARAEAWTVFEDVRPVLEELIGEYQLCVLSNFDRRLRNILHGHHLSPYFERVVLSSEVGASKPHARMFESVQQLFDAAPEECLHVGDDVECDVQGALRRGWQAYAVRRPEAGLEGLLEKVR
jgi:putative hydrolase of the HAD superfamily